MPFCINDLEKRFLDWRYCYLKKNRYEDEERTRQRMEEDKRREQLQYEEFTRNVYQTGRAPDNSNSSNSGSRPSSVFRQDISISTDRNHFLHITLVTI
jgi:hypothetical protein